jgi:hypothetical protein
VINAPQSSNPTACSLQDRLLGRFVGTEVGVEGTFPGPVGLPPGAGGREDVGNGPGVGVKVRVGLGLGPGVPLGSQVKPPLWQFPKTSQQSPLAPHADV